MSQTRNRAIVLMGSGLLWIGALSGATAQEVRPAHEQALLSELAEEAARGGGRPAPSALVTGAAAAALGPGIMPEGEERVVSEGGATFTWQVPDRYDDSWEAWDPIRTVEVESPVPHTETVYGYGSSFVHPQRWPLILNGCASRSPDGTPLSFRWTIRREGELIAGGERGASCEMRVPVPEEGRFDVTMEIESEGGARDVVSASVDVEDLVILSFGDSSASGEGNPDEAGLDAGWAYSRCHKSKTSGHALTAETLEDRSDQSSVTFLAFACSGAKLSAGVLEPYEGIAPGLIRIPEDAPPTSQRIFPATIDLAAQVDAAREALCSVPVDRCRPVDMRPVDYVFVSIGVNDLSFSDVVTLCGNLDLGLQDLGSFFLTEILEGPCSENVNLSSRLANAMVSLNTLAETSVAAIIACDLSDAEWKETLGYVPDPRPPYCFDGRHSTFGELRRRLAAAGIRPSRGIYLSTYPAEPFSANDGDIESGCGIFRFINEDEARFLTKWGYDLNELIHKEAIRNGFYSVPGITKAFRTHGYCAGGIRTGMVGPDGEPVRVGSDSYFVGFTESIIKQLGIHGTIHPNRRGHEAIRDAFLEAIAADKPNRRPTHRATMIVESVRFDVPRSIERTAIDADLSFWLRSFEAVDNPEVEADGGKEEVTWKRVHSSQMFDAVPGRSMPLPEPVRMEIDLSPADSLLEFIASAVLPAHSGNTFRERPRPAVDEDLFEDGISIPPDPRGSGIWSYRIQRQALRGKSESPYRPGRYTLRSGVDFGGNPGFVTLEVCLIVSPLRVRPLRPPTEANLFVCPARNLSPDEAPEAPSAQPEGELDAPNAPPEGQLEAPTAPSRDKQPRPSRPRRPVPARPSRNP